MAETKIEWAHFTFNPWRGCVKVSPACTHCYAEGWAKRTGKDIWGQDAAREFAAPAYWKQPLQWNKEAAKEERFRRVFCSSLADVFEDREALKPSRRRLFDIIEATPNLIWLLLSKRPENMNRLSPAHWERFGWPKNAWAGTTAENQEWFDKRVAHLTNVPARIHFMSLEPLLGSIDISGHLLAPHLEGVKACHGVNWVIVGGESGGGARPMHPVWARDLRDQCQKADVPFLFKQWGEYGVELDGKHAFTPVHSGVAMDEPSAMYRVGKKIAGRVLDGRTWDQVPMA